MKQIEVTILDQSYLLGCPEGGEATLLEAVSRVDKEMASIRHAGKIKARERIAVLAALNLAYALAQAKDAPVVATTPAQRTSDKATASAPEIDQLIHRIDQLLSAGGQLL